MQKQNVDLLLIRKALHELYNLVSAMEAVQKQNNIQAHQLSIQDSRISRLEKNSRLIDINASQELDSQKQQIEECKDLILTRIRNQDLEIEKLRSLVNWYCVQEE
jgi:hypothetical protein